MNEPTEATPSRAPRVVRLGDPMVCAHCHTSAQVPSVPFQVKPDGWLVRCTGCGWVARLRPHFGDRPQDVCYVVEEEIPAEIRRKYAAFLQACQRPLPGGSTVHGHPDIPGEHT